MRKLTTSQRSCRPRIKDGKYKRLKFPSKQKIVPKKEKLKIAASAHFKSAEQLRAKTYGNKDAPGSMLKRSVGSNLVFSQNLLCDNIITKNHVEKEISRFHVEPVSKITTVRLDLEHSRLQDTLKGPKSARNEKFSKSNLRTQKRRNRCRAGQIKYRRPQSAPFKKNKSKYNLSYAERVKQRKMDLKTAIAFCDRVLDHNTPTNARSSPFNYLSTEFHERRTLSRTERNQPKMAKKANFGKICGREMYSQGLEDEGGAGIDQQLFLSDQNFQKTNKGENPKNGQNRGFGQVTSIEASTVLRRKVYDEPDGAPTVNPGYDTKYSRTFKTKTNYADSVGKGTEFDHQEGGLGERGAQEAPNRPKTAGTKKPKNKVPILFSLQSANKAAKQLWDGVRRNSPAKPTLSQGPEIKKFENFQKHKLGRPKSAAVLKGSKNPQSGYNQDPNAFQTDRSHQNFKKSPKIQKGQLRIHRTNIAYKTQKTDTNDQKSSTGTTNRSKGRFSGRKNFIKLNKKLTQIGSSRRRKHNKNSTKVKPKISHRRPKTFVNPKDIKKPSSSLKLFYVKPESVKQLERGIKSRIDFRTSNELYKRTNGNIHFKQNLNFFYRKRSCNRSNLTSILEGRVIDQNSVRKLIVGEVESAQKGSGVGVKFGRNKASGGVSRGGGGDRGRVSEAMSLKSGSRSVSRRSGSLSSRGDGMLSSGIYGMKSAEKSIFSRLGKDGKPKKAKNEPKNEVEKIEKNEFLEAFFGTFREGDILRKTNAGIEAIKKVWDNKNTIFGSFKNEQSGLKKTNKKAPKTSIFSRVKPYLRLTGPGRPKNLDINSVSALRNSTQNLAKSGISHLRLGTNNFNEFYYYSGAPIQAENSQKSVKNLTQKDHHFEIIPRYLKRYEISFFAFYKLVGKFEATLIEKVSKVLHKILRSFLRMKFKVAYKREPELGSVLDSAFKYTQKYVSDFHYLDAYNSGVCILVILIYNKKVRRQIMLISGRIRTT